MRVTEATLCQTAEPPVTVGVVGSVRSIRTVFVPPATVGCQSDAFPAASSPWNSTSVSPSADTSTAEPGDGDDHVTPPSLDARYR